MTLDALFETTITDGRTDERMDNAISRVAFATEKPKMAYSHDAFTRDN